jgi:hypothetical protein
MGLAAACFCIFVFMNNEPDGLRSRTTCEEPDGLKPELRTKKPDRLPPLLFELRRTRKPILHNGDG